MIFLGEIIFVEWYSYNNRHLSLLNASYLLNVPVSTHKVKRRLGSVEVFMRSFTVHLRLILYISSSAHLLSAGGLRHVPSPSLVSLKEQPPISNSCSTLVVFLFNETKKTNCYLLARDNRSYFLISPTMDLPWYGYVMYFQGIQTPRSQFKWRNKFGLTRHKDIPH